MMEDDDRDGDKAESFGRWLVVQKDRGDWVNGLADAARKDRAFPKNGDVAEVKKWLQGKRASGDDWEALDDAESAWQSQ